MKTLFPKTAPKVGNCYRLTVTRHETAMHYLVLILACEGEWCTVLDLEPAYGTPNRAAGERIPWRNAHVQFQLFPKSCLAVRRGPAHATFRRRGWATVPPSRSCSDSGRDIGHHRTRRQHACVHRMRLRTGFCRWLKKSSLGMDANTEMIGMFQ